MKDIQVKMTLYISDLQEEIAQLGEALSRNAHLILNLRDEGWGRYELQYEENVGKVLEGEIENKERALKEVLGWQKS